jgi:flagellar protein FliL
MFLNKKTNKNIVACLLLVEGIRYSKTGTAMAKKNLEEDLDLGIEPDKGSKKKLIIISAIALLVLIGGGLGIGWFLLGGEDAEVAEEQVEENKEQLPAIYYPMDPVFVVNLPEGSEAKLLQASVQVMARGQETIDFVQHNDPMIRHNLLNLFASHTGQELGTRKGKERLQTDVLKRLNKIIKDQGGSGEIEAVYFTSFVMQ